MASGCDAGTAPADDAASGPDAPATLVALPVLTPCPPGWREVTADGVAICEPFPASAPEACAQGEAQLPGRPGCEPIGATCRADGWPTDLPAGGPVVYVDDDGPADGDGATRASAFRSPDVALAVSPADAVVAIAAGTYAGHPLLLDRQHVVGACARLVHLQPDFAADGMASVSITGDGASLRDVSIEASMRPGIIVTGTGVTLDAVEIDAPLGIGLHAFAGSTTARHLVVRDVQAHDLISDAAILARATLEIDGAVLVRAMRTGLEAFGAGAVVHASDVSIRETRAERPPPEVGPAVAIDEGGSLTLERASLADDAGVELVVLGTGSPTLVARDVAIRASSSVDAPWGVLLAAGTSTLERVSFVGTAATALSVRNGASATVRDVCVRDERPWGPHESAPGIWASGGASLTLERGLVADTNVVALASTGATTLASDVTLLRIARAPCADTVCPDDSGGFGLLTDVRGSLRVSRFLIDGAAVCGAVVGVASALDLDHGIVTHAPIGACIQVDGYDPERLHQEVSFVAVDVPLQATSYTLPPPP